VTKILNSGPPYYLRIRYKLERSNFTRTLRLSSTVKSAQEFAPMGACSGSRNQNCKFGTPLLSLDSLKLERSNFTCALRLSSTIKIAQEFAPMGACSGSRDQNIKLGTPYYLSCR